MSIDDRYGRYGGDLANRDVDQVRALLGDTGPSFLLSDSEIVGALQARADVVKAAALDLAWLLAGKFAGKLDRALGPNLRLSGGAASAKHYQAIARRLQAELIAETGGVFAGGTTLSEKAAAEADGNRSAPSFSRGLHDFQSRLAE